MPSFKCKDIGLSCGFEAKANTRDELMGKISKHASSAHNMTTISTETMNAIKGAIKE